MVNREMFRNVLDKHPDGLGKHIEVYPGVRITQKEFDILTTQMGELPFAIIYEQFCYLIIIGGDIINREFTEPPTGNIVSSIIEEIKPYLNQVYKYLKFNPALVSYKTSNW